MARVSRQRQRGVSYVEILATLVLIGAALVPIVDALGTAGRSGSVYRGDAARDLRQQALLEQMLAMPYGALLDAAAEAGTASVASRYSEPVGTTNRLIVLIGRYDGDTTPFTVPDPDLDGDGDPFTGYTGLLWVGVRSDDADLPLASLTGP